MGGLDYLAFVVPGMMAYSAMFAASFETTIGSFSRFSFQKTWDAVLATPVSLLELLLGEALWASCKALFSAVCVLVGRPRLGRRRLARGRALEPAADLLAGFAFAACGLAATAHAKSWEFFSYFFTFWVTPMFVFSGVFFGVDRFPVFVQPIAWILPMTHVIEVVRPLTAGQPLSLPMALLHIGYVAALGAVAFTLAYRRLRIRLFD